MQPLEEEACVATRFARERLQLMVLSKCATKLTIQCGILEEMTWKLELKSTHAVQFCTVWYGALKQIPIRLVWFGTDRVSRGNSRRWLLDGAEARVWGLPPEMDGSSFKLVSDLGFLQVYVPGVLPVDCLQPPFHLGT
jgi:hypothetical protein